MWIIVGKGRPVLFLRLLFVFEISAFPNMDRYLYFVCNRTEIVHFSYPVCRNCLNCHSVNLGYF